MNFRSERGVDFATARQTGNAFVATFLLDAARWSPLQALIEFT